MRPLATLNEPLLTAISDLDFVSRIVRASCTGDNEFDTAEPQPVGAGAPAKS